MQEADYFEDFGEGNDDDDEEEEEGALPSRVGSKKGTPGSKGPSGGKVKDQLMGELEDLALGEGDPSGVEIERLARDVSRLTEGQKLSLLHTQSPELLGVVGELRVIVGELRDVVHPRRVAVASLVEGGRAVEEEVVEYLEVKEQLLLSYSVNVMFYLYMKAQGASVRAHPVLRQLLELRYAMEKMRGLDGKMEGAMAELDGVRREGVVGSSSSGRVRGGREVVGSDEEEEESGEEEEEEGSGDEEEERSEEGNEEGSDEGSEEMDEDEERDFEDEQYEQIDRTVSACVSACVQSRCANSCDTNTSIPRYLDTDLVILPSPHCLLHTALSTLPSPYCLLHTAFSILPSPYCLLHTEPSS